tara:strand:- start:5168 stop:6193 length:1026 start_codon:yes stop_codon:yes gene_type:complete
VRWSKPWLWLPPQCAHDISPYGARTLGALSFSKVPPQWKPLKWKNLYFPNPLGIAGGVDKDGIGTPGWWRLGAGFCEVGTVTPAPQSANPKPRVSRDEETLALWNRLGFPSQGALKVKHRLEKLKRPYPGPLFVNIGKNRNTPLDEAHLDYEMLVQNFDHIADVFVINVSSPNTKGLRQLLDEKNLNQLLLRLQPQLKESGKPFLLKLSPDLSADDLKKVLDVSMKQGANGWVLTNTTLFRPPNSKFPETGGLSGAPLRERARNFLTQTLEHLGSEKKDHLVVAAGGVLYPEDVMDRLELGADLVQTYSALVYNGPYFFQQVNRWQQRPKTTSTLKNERPG